MCGIPSVTLDGKRSDWEELYRRLGRLYDLGKEPAIWAEMLRPIVRRFVTAFDGEPDASFWGHVAYRNQEVCGQDDLSGWITAFCVWSNEGVWKGGRLPEDVPPKPAMMPGISWATKPATKGLGKVIPKWLRRRSKSLAPKLREDSSDGAQAVDTDSKGDTGAPSEGSLMVKGKLLNTCL